MKTRQRLLPRLVVLVVAGCSTGPVTPDGETEYAISGRVTDPLGQGLGGVEIAFGGGFGQVLTDFDGRWRKSGLRGQLIVRPRAGGLIFVPDSAVVQGSADDIDFTAAAEFVQAQTDGFGQAILSSQLIDLSVQITTEDAFAQRLGGVRLQVVVSPPDVGIVAFDPSGRFFSEVQGFTVAGATGLASSSAASEVGADETVVLETIIILSSVFALGSFVHEWVTDGPERTCVFDVANGQFQECFTGDINDLVSLVGVILGAQGAAHVIMRGGGNLMVHFGVAAGATAVDLFGKFSEYMDREHQICFNEGLEGEGGEPLVVTVGPLDIQSGVQPPGVVFESVVATGNVAGHVANLSVFNTTQQGVRYLIQPGVSFANGSSGARQDMTVIRSVVANLQPGGRLTVPVSGACINLFKGPPFSGDLFFPFGEQRPDLVALGRAIDRVAPVDRVAQQAVWVISDGVAPFSLQEVVQLFLAAGLDPAAYPALRGNVTPSVVPKASWFF